MIAPLLAAALWLLAAPEVSLVVSPDEPEVGLVMTVQLTVSGSEGADCELLALPEMDGARLGRPVGPSHQSYTEIINGRTRQTVSTIWQFELVPERAGRLVLPPVELTCRGETVSTEPQVLDVAASSLIEDIVRLEITPSTTDAWVGQVIDFEIELSILETAHDMLARNGLELWLPWLGEVPQLHMLEPPVPSCSRGVMTALPGEQQLPTCTDRRRVDGRVRILYQQSVPMLATGAGTFTLPDSRFSARIVVERQRASNDPFGGGFFRLARTTPSRALLTDARAPGDTITIREPPLEGRPDSFTGAVGRYTFELEAKPTTLKVGESCQLRFALTPGPGVPAGQLPLLRWPEFEASLDGFRIFGKDDSSDSRRRLLDLEVSPSSPRVTEIPALSFSWFDPSTARYETVTRGPIALDVEDGGAEGLADLLETQQVLNDLETIRESLPPPADERVEPWWLPAAALGLLALVESRRAARRSRDRNPEAQARKGARARLHRELARCDDVASVAAAFSRYLSARLAGPVGGMTAEEAAPRFDDDALRAELRGTVQGWEAAYLAGATLSVDEARSQARALAKRLESARTTGAAR